MLRFVPALARLGRRASARFSALLVATLLPAAAAAPSDSTICGWTIESDPANAIQLLPASVPPWIDPTFPCSCCVSGAKYGLGVFGAQDGAPAYVFYSLGTASLPVAGQVLMVDPSQLVGSTVLLPDPTTPSFANVCWVVDDCLTIPENPALVGLELYLQAAAAGFSPPHDWTLSNRLTLLIGTQF